MWHVYWEYCEVKLSTISGAFMSYPLEGPLKFYFILFFLRLRQSATAKGYPSICILFIIWTFYINISFSVIQFNYNLESHSSTDGTGNFGVLLLTLVVLQHLHLSLK